MRHVVDIAEPSAVAEARRMARQLTEGAGLSEERGEAAAIVATEMATNLLRHAGGGQILLQVQPGRPATLALAAIDRGPGIADPDAALADGYSTAGSAGGGLGAMRRLADGFEMRSTPGAGTVVLCRFGRARPVLGGVEAGAFLMNYPGDRACGDAFAARDVGGRVDLAVIDGLGHGPRAQDAAEEAVAGLGAQRGDDPAQSLTALSKGLAGSRGSVIGLAQIEAAERRLRFAGIGNISAMVFGGDGRLRRLICREGRIGGQTRTPPVEQVDFTPGDTLILHSDGLASIRSIGELPQMAGASCAMIAAQLMQGRNRGRDDACALVARLAMTEGA
ncbi:ATP-binding protein [Limimaricola pyoseonensis]|uniref:Anti-sigma regulatory factor (Ser/Thr protein kinase) n=1 Tax=Limimaricola pyoseonensis TaxID=521013 RepID=A0A1G7D877_9RHOB|nr:ATP-binding protein [Limimaricola pyoseonensis]SDE47838.1 Anti-sigma regulatory factor (Ser/Thr protein kinase) [Limimaricola pyoseonensis]